MTKEIEVEIKKEGNPDGKGNIEFPVDIETDDIEFLFKKYLQDNNYSKASVDHFNILLEEEKDSLETIMGRTVLNECIVRALEKAMKEGVFENENS